MAKFKVGQLVVLPAFEDQPEERAVVKRVQVRHPGMYIVEVENAADEFDDRTREVHEDGMRAEE